VNNEVGAKAHEEPEDTMTRRTWLTLLPFLGVLLAAPAVWGADFPTRPVRFLVGFAPGGGTDVLARIIAQQLSQKWGQPVVVENRPGATGKIAEELVATSPPDGYTILMVPSAFTIVGDKKPTHHPAKAFTPIVRPAMIPDILVVNPAILKVGSLKELIEMAKADPKRFFYGTPGENSPPHMESELIKKMAGVNLTHVPYAGSSAAMLAVMKGDIQMTFASVQGSLGAIESGKLQPLAVSTAFRSARLPNVPTVAEAAGLPGYDGGGSWYGVLGPAGIPKDVVNKINADMVAVTKSPEVQKMLAEQGFVTIADSPTEFAQFIDKDIAKWDELQKWMREQPK
jgi:tripartite-type tricarboxylate transporter receptor subunit TctC